MRREKRAFISVLLAAAFLLQGFAVVTAADTSGLTYDTYAFIVSNDEAVTFPDSVPEIRDGVTYVPVRFFAESLGAAVGWDEATQTATLTKEETVIAINREAGTVSNGSAEQAFDMFTKNDRIMVPYRFIAESFGYEVSYIDKGSIARVKNADAALTDEEIYEKYIDQILEEKKEVAKDSGIQEDINAAFDAIEARKEEIAANEVKAHYAELDAQKAEIDEKYKDIPADKIVYITMDDGPSTRTTEPMLDLFYIYDMDVTFFLKGSQIKYASDSVKRMVTDGHTVAMHSMTHNQEKSFATDTTLVEEFKEEADILEPIIGSRPKLVRIPFSEGLLTPAHKQNLLNEGYIFCGFNIDTGDWALTEENCEQALEAIKAELPKYESGEAVILHHDTPQTLKIMPEILAYLRENGYKSMPLTEDMGDTPDIFTRADSE